MKFEQFEKEIKESGYGIVAMNHYTLGGKRHTYCVVLSQNSEQAIKAEGENSEDVFSNICEQINKMSK